MKEIIITASNASKIKAEIDAVQKQCRARTIDVADIISYTDLITQRMGVPLAHLEGCEFRVDTHAQHFPNAYRGMPESTQFTLLYKSRKWRLTGVFREQCHNGLMTVWCKLTPEAEMAIVKKYSQLSL